MGEFLDFQNAVLGKDVGTVDALLKKVGGTFATGAEADADMDADGMFAVEAESAGDQSAPPAAVSVVPASTSGGKTPKEDAVIRRGYQLASASSSGGKTPKQDALIRRSYQLVKTPKEDAMIRRSYQLAPASKTPKQDALIRRSY